jgi:hypothetical protein
MKRLALISDIHGNALALEYVVTVLTLSRDRTGDSAGLGSDDGQALVVTRKEAQQALDDLDGLLQALASA